MRLFKKSEDTADEKTVQIGTPWTKGEQLKTTALRVALWAVIFSGPTLGFLAIAQSQNHEPAAAVEVAPSESRGREEAEEIAVRAVTDWLSSSRDAAKEMVSFYPRTNRAATGLELRDPDAFRADFRDGEWQVTVAVTVITTTPAEREDEPPVITEQRRYFQQPVLVDGEGAVWIVSLPAEVPGPQVGSAERSSYTLSVSLTDPLVGSAQGFFDALLTGTGDIDRYVTPGVDIDSVEPAPFSTISILHARADGEVPAHSEGATTDVMFRIEASTDKGVATTFDYELTLISRSERWEIASIGGAATPTPLPSESPSPPTAPTTPAVADGRPSTDGETHNNS